FFWRFFFASCNGTNIGHQPPDIFLSALATVARHLHTADAVGDYTKQIAVDTAVIVDAKRQIGAATALSFNAVTKGASNAEQTAPDIGLLDISRKGILCGT